MSLRNQKKIEGEILKYTLQKKEYTGYIYTIQFPNLQEELGKLYFKRAEVESSQPVRYVIGIPISKLIEYYKEKTGSLMTEDDFMQYMIDKMREIKKALGNEKYILCDGTIAGEFVHSLNCVTGFYKGLGVEGKEANPSPQMAAWSLVDLLLGMEKSKSLLGQTRIRFPDIERTLTDELGLTFEEAIRYTSRNYKA